MKAILISIAVVFIIFPAAEPALANQPPGPLIMLPEISILPIMILFSILGGAYSIMGHSKEKPGPKSYHVVIAFIIIFLSGVHEGLGLLVVLIFGIIAFARGFQMFVWGLETLPTGKRPEHLLEANPYRLIASGICLNIIVIFLAGVAFIFGPYRHSTSMSYHESSAIGSMRTIASAQNTFQSSALVDVDSDGIGEYGDLKMLAEARPPYIDEVLAAGTKSGYSFRIILSGTADSDEKSWWAVAYPIKYGSSGKRTFYIDESGVVRGIDFNSGASINRSDADPEKGGKFPPVGY